MQTLANELLDKTQTYWRLSRAWNGRSKEEIATDVAITVSNDTIFGTNQARPIVKAFQSLLDEVIAGCGKPLVVEQYMDIQRLQKLYPDQSI